MMVRKGGLSMAGEGQMLQAAREQKQWSYEYTEEVTKIRIRYIKALEEEKYEILPGITYTKGYLRTYAKHLGLNPDEIIALYNSSATAESIPVDESLDNVVKTRPPWLVPAILGGLAVLAVVLVIAIASLSGEKAETTYSPPALPTVPETEVVTQTPSPPVVTDPEPEEAIEPTEEGLTAQLVFTRDCWMEIRIDGQPSFQELFRAGTTKELKAINKIEFVRIGNAAGLSVTLNGKKLPSFQDGNKVVINNVVLTKDTLKAQ
jgi:cytoskeleton protein RodZ